MEDERIRKKNRKQKKKNKQRAAEDTTSNAGDTSSSEQNHVLEMNNRSVESDGGNDDESIKIVIGKSDQNSVSADPGKQNWMREETRLREMIKKQLYEKDSYLQRQADMEMKIKQLQLEIECCNQKEVILRQTISQLLQNKASGSPEERDLQERIRHIERDKALLVEKENLSKEAVTVLTNENTRLQNQVVELEGAKNNLSQQNRQLTENVSTLQLRIQDLERSFTSKHSSVDEQNEVSKKEALNAQMEESCALVEKLVAENAELLKKVNELNTELGRWNVGVSTSAKSFVPFEKVPIKDEQIIGDNIDFDYATLFACETEAQDMEAQIPIDLEKKSVPFIDAPVIGAPFRLISFFASYVSGADLVNSNSSSSSETAS